MTVHDNSAPASALLNGNGLGGHAPLNGTWYDAGLPASRAQIRIDAKRRQGAGAAETALPAAEYHRHVLPPAAFGARVQREKRRCERSAAALSVVVYQHVPDDADACAPLGQLLDALYGLTREGDVLGRLSNGAIALLCTDTDEAGVRAVIAKVAARVGALPFKPVTATYPNQLFDAIGRAVELPREGGDLLAIEGIPESRRGYAGKRLLYVTAALIALIALAPLMLLTALAIACDSRGPIIYRQRRIGLGGAPFVFYKFRSMWTGVDDRIHRDFALRFIKRGDAAKTTAGATDTYKLKSDSRITRVGRFIRKTSIDELPQLFNVLKGDMSLVGPRPPLPYEAANYEPWHLRRVLAIKPGITGLWQVDGRSRVGFNEMVRMDLRYIRDCSALLDLKILAKTVLVVLSCNGAR